MILNPKRLTWSLYWKMIRTPYSTLRTLEYVALDGERLVGRTLDVGGGKNTSYNHLLRIEGTIESLNIDPQIVPTYTADLNKSFPFESAIYDNILSLNTLEHIRNDEAALREMVRILKPGGKLLLIVPFLYQVHASPYDYHRHTALWWQEKLEELGFCDEDIEINPLMWDQLGTGLALSEKWSLPGIPFRRVFWRVRRAIMLLYGVMFQSLRWRTLERIPGKDGERQRNFALGYLIRARKSGVVDMNRKDGNDRALPS